MLLVRCTRYDSNGISNLVGHIVDGSSILVIPVADIAVLVSRFAAAIYQALSVVRVSYSSPAAQAGEQGWTNPS